jgi:hypothetical protein
VVSAFARVVRRDRALAECNVVRFRHADIQVHFRRQLKRFLGLDVGALTHKRIAPQDWGLSTDLSASSLRTRCMPLLSAQMRHLTS